MMGITYTVVKKEDIEKGQKAGKEVLKKDGFSFEINIGKQKTKYSADLSKVLNKSTLLLLPALFFFLGEVVCEILFLLRLEEITNHAFEGMMHMTNLEIRKALPFLLGMLIFGLLEVRFQRVYTYKSVNLIKECTTWSIMQLHPDSFRRKNVAEYVSFLTNNTRSVENDYLLARYNAITGIVQIIAGVVLSIRIDWRLLLISAIIVSVIYMAIAALMGGLGKRTEQWLTALETFTTKTREVLCAFHLIKINNLVDNVKNEMAAEIEAVQEKQQKLDKSVMHIGIVVQFLVSSVIFAILSYTIIAMINGKLTVGEIVFLFSAFAFVLMPGISVMQIMPNLKEGEVVLKELDDWCFVKGSEGLVYSKIPMDKEASEKNKCISKTKQPGKQMEPVIKKDAITFGKVCFDYGKEILFDEFTFCFQKGKKYLIVGESGCGKTTLLKLMLGLMRPASGNIWWNGQKYEALEENQIHSVISYLPQVPVLFNDTVWNNICLDQKQDKEFFWDVVKNTQLDKFVLSLNEKENYVINDSSTNVSGGEKTRIALARALYSNADYLLLDEPFANLDKETSVAIEKTLLGLQEKCVVVVSHVINEENLAQYDEVVRL